MDTDSFVSAVVALVCSFIIIATVLLLAAFGG